MTRAMLFHILGRPAAQGGFLMVALSLAFALALTVFHWLPASTAAAAAEASLERLRTEREMLEMADRLAERYSARIAEVELLEGKLGAATDDPEFIRNAEKLATTSGAAIQHLSSEPMREDKAKVSTAGFEFLLSARYANLKTFLVSLQRMPELVAVEQVLLEMTEQDVRGRVVIKRVARR